MKEFIIPVNNEAHSRALEAIVGPETAQLILKAYKAIDSAMCFGYERGTADTIGSRNEENAKEDYKNGYDEGYHQRQEDQWEAGYSKGLSDGFTQTDDQCDYDDGYVHGVSDARLFPAVADREVARLCEADEDRGDIFDCSEYTPIDDVYYNGDSGDETDEPYTGSKAY